ncbi:MAG: hypothetical protein ACERKV_10485 [Clostridiaceae bacterium]
MEKKICSNCVIVVAIIFAVIISSIFVVICNSNPKNYSVDSDEINNKQENLKQSKIVAISTSSTKKNIEDEVDVLVDIDGSEPNMANIGNKEKYTHNNWYNSSQTIKASFTQTSGSQGKLQFKVNDEDWADGDEILVSTEGENYVSYRVVDSLGGKTIAETVQVNIDMTAPINPEIYIEKKKLKSFFNTISFGIFHMKTLEINITVDSNISGLKKIECQNISKNEEYNPEGTWSNYENPFTIESNDQSIIYAKITDKAGNFVIINTESMN